MRKQTLFGFRFDYESLLALLVLLPFLFACSRLGVESKKSSNPKEEKGLVGTWKNENATLQIKANGTMTINNVKYLYKASKDVITITGNDGNAELPYTLDDDTLTVTYQGKKAVYKRVKQSSGNGDNAGGNIRRELIGKWCYLSSVTTNDGGRMSDRCITLRENGTYEYYAETTSSGDNGGTYSQNSESGTWSATEDTITANSESEGARTYSLEKRNHPKTGDPMIIIDGDAYVTYNQRDPW